MKSIKKILSEIPVYIVLGWVVFALSIDLYLVYLHFSGNEQSAIKFSKELVSKLN